ncbi:hypothetical protein SAMN05216540_11716 [Butyrivibrio sp. M55]|nr:hypothetical protein SAMN05216540_11716 [Butyrivibrio sp. M55]
MYRKEMINEFLANEKEECDFLKRAAKKYNLNEFVMVDKNIKSILSGKMIDGCEDINGCMFDYREKDLRLNVDSVELRLANQYLGFIKQLLEEKEKDIVLYILAFHYLAMIKQFAYQLVVSNKAPFWGCDSDFNTSGKSNYKLYQELCIGKFGGMIPFLSEACIAKYNNIFYKYGFDSHSTKHFSLIEYMLKHENMYGDGFSLCNEFVYMLNSFCFQFKAIYTTEKMWPYMFKANKDYIINSLIFLY